MRKVPNKIDPLSDTVLPAGYRACEYLEGTGTQWCDTGYTPNNKTQLESRACWTEFNATGLATAYTVWDLSGRGVSTGSCYLNGICWLSHCPTLAYTTGGMTPNVWFTSTFNRHGKSLLLSDDGVTNGGAFDPSPGGTFTLSFTLPVFRWRRNDGWSAPGKLKLRHLKIWEDDVPIHSFVAALDQKGNPCFVCTITGKTLYNVGSGQFLYKLR